MDGRHLLYLVKLRGENHLCHEPIHLHFEQVVCRHIRDLCLNYCHGKMGTKPSKIGSYRYMVSHKSLGKSRSQPKIGLQLWICATLRND